MEKEIIDLYLSGLTSREVAKKVNKSQSTILRVLRKNNLVREQHLMTTEELKKRNKAIAASYNSGNSVSEVAFHVSEYY